MLIGKNSGNVWWPRTFVPGLQAKSTYQTVYVTGAWHCSWDNIISKSRTINQLGCLFTIYHQVNLFLPFSIYVILLNILNQTPHVQVKKALSMQLCVALNMPFKDIESDDAESSEIPTLIRFFNEDNRSEIAECHTRCNDMRTYLMRVMWINKRWECRF